MYTSVNASILDVGCGEGAISDFITPDQKKKYVGVDLSKEAIQFAKVVVVAVASSLSDFDL